MTTTPSPAALCGDITGEYGPCARPSGHPEAYCRNAAQTQLWLRNAESAPAEPTPDAGLRQRTVDTLRWAVYVCGEECDASDDAACHAAHPVQAGAIHHGTVTDLHGPIDALAAALLPLLAAERAAGRNDGLREGADLAHEEGAALYSDMGQKAAAGAWLVRDRLRTRADATRQDGGQA